MEEGTEYRAEARQHYDLERRLADRLRAANKTQRQSLYWDVYDELYAGLGGMGLLHRVQQNSSRQLTLLREILDPLLAEANSFVEFGSGDGALRVAIAESHPHLMRVTAIDACTIPAGSMPQKQAVVTYLAPAETRSEIGSSNVDLAFSCHFVEHLHPEDLNDHFLEVRRVLKPAGRYLLITPNILLGPHDVSREFDAVATGLHLQEYGYRSLAASMRRAGFHKVEAVLGAAAPFRVVPLALASAAEVAAGLLPRSLRRGVSRSFGKRQPFRALEQVKLLASS